MTKLNDKQRKKIIADYIENQNYSETGRMNNVAVNTVKKIIIENKGVANKLKQKKEENTLSTLEYMDKQHETKKNILNKLLKAIEEKADNVDMFTNVKDLATAYGIIIDKELKRKEIELKNSENNQEIEKGKELLIAIKKVAGENEYRD